MDTKKYLINREFSQRTYQSAKNYADQQRLPTEKAKDDATGETPESEFAQPYGEFSVSYGEMEYYMQSPTGQAGARTESVWDVPWVPPQQTSESFEEYWSGRVVGDYVWVSYHGPEYYTPYSSQPPTPMATWNAPNWDSVALPAGDPDWSYLYLRLVGTWYKDLNPTHIRIVHTAPNIRVVTMFQLGGGEMYSERDYVSGAEVRLANWPPNPENMVMYHTCWYGDVTSYSISDIQLKVPLK